MENSVTCKEKKSKITSLGPSLEIEGWAEEIEKAMEDFDFEESVQSNNTTFACCILTQRILSVFCECMLSHEEFDPLAEIIEKMQEEYTPLGPPMSPLTTSYFSYWLLYDVKYKNMGTLAENFLSYASELGMGKLEKESIAAFSSSRMGIYEHIGFEEDYICLKELVTDQITRVICPAGYLGKKGELWLVRVFSALFPEDAHVAATTPYILTGHKKCEWIDFYKRNKIVKGAVGLHKKNHDFMKYGPSIDYWHEFIFLSYVNYTSNHIILSGIPDLKGTKPHE